jgi:hypothetical protein
MDRKSYLFIAAAGLALTFSTMSVKAQTAVTTDETMLPAVIEPAPVVENVPARQAEVPLPPSRPSAVPVRRQASAARPRQQVAVRPVPAQTRPIVVAERPSPERVALSAKPKSPLFWMTVGVGF